MDMNECMDVSVWMWVWIEEGCRELIAIWTSIHNVRVIMRVLETLKHLILFLYFTADQVALYMDMCC